MRMSHTFIIIGATGGIGSALSRKLSAAGHTIHAIGRDPARLAALTAETGGSHAVADVTDRTQLEAAVKAAGPAVAGLAYLCIAGRTVGRRAASLALASRNRRRRSASPARSRPPGNDRRPRGAGQTVPPGASAPRPWTSCLPAGSPGR